MLSALNYLISLKKWQNKRPGGQIATLLLVVMVAILIFILVTVNLGNLSISSTQLSNAADKAGFYLGSQLASRSNTLYKSLGNKVKKCWKKGGFFSMGSLLAIAFAVAAVVAAGVFAPVAASAFTIGGIPMATGTAAIAAGALGGMVGGAIGGGISGGGVLMGAVQGAMIGASVGAIAGSAASMLGTPTQALSVAQAAHAVEVTQLSLLQTKQAVLKALANVATASPQTASTATQAATTAIRAASTVTRAASTAQQALVAAKTGTQLQAAQAAATAKIAASTAKLAELTAQAAARTVLGLTNNSGFFSSLWGKTFGSNAFQQTIGSPGGRMATGSLSLGRQAYSSISTDAKLSSTLSALARSLSGLPEYERYREGAFLQALSETIDDPRTLPDAEDINGNGNTEERIPYFSWWWQKRQNKNGETIPILTGTTRSFIEGPFTNFDTQARSKYGCSQPLGGSQLPGELVRQEECAYGDGLVIDLARVLKGWGYAVSFWKPGLPPPGPDGENCDNENNCVGQDYDAVETVVSELKDFNLEAEIVQRDKESGQVTNIPALTSTWKNWIKIFYRTDAQGKHIDYEFVEGGKGDFIREGNGGYKYVGQGRGDYERNDDSYNSFGRVIEGEDLNNNGIYGEDNIAVPNGEVVDELKGLRRWKQDFEGIRSQLPDCQYCRPASDEFEYCTFQVPPQTEGGWYIKNPPCKRNDIVSPSGYYFGSTDSDLKDEFTPVQEKLDASIQEAQNFRTALKNYFKDMDWISTISLSEWGGTNPITYSWDDSRGRHSVIVQAGPFKIPWIKKKKKKKKLCLILMDYQDNGSNTWIRVTRNDPANKDIGLLGKWNPQLGVDGKINIDKISRVSFSYDHIDIGGTR